MANTTTQAFLFLASALVILGTTTLPKANAVLIINGINVRALALNGTIRCSSTLTGPCINCPPLPNVGVDISLNNNVIASAVTDRNGFFQVNVTVGNIINNLNDIAALSAVVRLPIPGCSIWANVTTGRLVGNIFLETLNFVSDIPHIAVSVFRFVL